MTINQKVDKSNDERKQGIAETNEKLEKPTKQWYKSVRKYKIKLMTSKMKIKRWLKAVSYTHLDVYKRQVKDDERYKIC